MWKHLVHSFYSSSMSHCTCACQAKGTHHVLRYRCSWTHLSTTIHHSKWTIQFHPSFQSYKNRNKSHHHSTFQCLNTNKQYHSIFQQKIPLNGFDFNGHTNILERMNPNLMKKAIVVLVYLLHVANRLPINLRTSIHLYACKHHAHATCDSSNRRSRHRHSRGQVSHTRMLYQQSNILDKSNHPSTLGFPCRTSYQVTYIFYMNRWGRWSND